WCNPPYSNIRPWVEKAAEQSRMQNQPVVMLVPEDMSVGWFLEALKTVDEIRVITGGRINFVNPVTGEEKNGNSKGSMLLIWRPFITPRRLSSFALKQELEAIGNQYLAEVSA
ncbi:phage N-6-adenine-methyltransferase, partial [Morganella morganii subsp. morganii]